METSKIDLAISLQPSFIESKTFAETIPLHYVEQLIENPCLKEKWDLTNYSQISASQNYINEKQQLQAYLPKWKKALKSFFVKYIKPRHKWGRVFPSKSLGSTSFAKRTRNTLIKNNYLDFDLSNAQPEILRNICLANNLPCETITKYCNEREQIIADIIKASGGTVDRALVKSLMISISFYGGFKGWLNENNIEPFAEPVIIADYCAEIRLITQLIKKKNMDMYKTIERNKKEKNEGNIDGAFLSTYLQEWELRIVENVLKHLCTETNICLTEIPNVFNAIYEFDGLKLFKEAIEKYGGHEKLLELMNKLNLEFGFDIKWEIKSIEKFYEIEFVDPIIVDKEEEREQKKEKKKLEKDLIKEKEIEYANEKKKEILKIKCEKYSKMKTEFQKTHFKIISKGVYFELSTNIMTKEQKLIVRSKKQLLDAYEHMAYDVDKEGNPISFIYDWVKDPDIKSYADADVFPVDSKCPKNTFNMWIPFLMEQYKTPYKPNIEGRDFLLNHIKVLCNHETEVYDYFMQWLAHLIIHPDQKSTCPVFISDEGAGKGSFIELLKRLLGSSKVFVTPSPDKYVWGSFNNLMNDAYFVALDELNKSMTIKANEVIKNLITDTTMNINCKGISSYNINSYHKYFMMTNKKDGGILTTKDDRRKFMVRCSDELINNEDYFNEFYEKIKDITILRTFYDYLKTIDAPEKLPHPPSTEYQETLKELSANPYELWLQYHSANMINEISLNKDSWIFDGGDYKCDENEKFIWYAKSNKLMESFNKWKSQNGFENYDTNSVKMGVNLKLLGVPFIKNKKTKICNLLVINLHEALKYYQNKL